MTARLSPPADATRGWKPDGGLSRFWTGRRWSDRWQDAQGRPCAGPAVAPVERPSSAAQRFFQGMEAHGERMQGRGQQLGHAGWEVMKFALFIFFVLPVFVVLVIGLFSILTH